MQTVPGKRIALLSVSLALSACGGGGGGTAPTTVTPLATTAFTKWSDVTPNVEYKADGLGQEVTGTASGGQFVAIEPSGVADGYSAYLTFDSALQLSQLKLTTPDPTLVVLDKAAAGTTFADVTFPPETSPQFVGARNSTDVAVMAKPIDLNWEWQTFGIWETDRDSLTSRKFGAMSVGAPTIGTAIPGSGTATFAGYSAGSYVDTAGKGTTVFAALTVGANFGTQTLTFNTANTQTSSDWVTFTPNNDLNLNGTLTYAPGTNRFTGSVNNPGSRLTGNSTGQFYGPNAEELGGVFLLQGSGVETYAGAYGAKQTP
ncbi:MAG: transferrin-binding protein-like solute binding protein [Thiobacillus sp.]|nr:transferrin-binding protein-like solute binding protein [Thiobacillus sp.]